MALFCQPLTSHSDKCRFAPGRPPQAALVPVFQHVGLALAWRSWRKRKDRQDSLPTQESQPELHGVASRGRPQKGVPKRAGTGVPAQPQPGWQGGQGPGRPPRRVAQERALPRVPCKSACVRPFGQPQDPGGISVTKEITFRTEASVSITTIDQTFLLQGSQTFRFN